MEVFPFMTWRPCLSLVQRIPDHAEIGWVRARIRVSFNSDVIFTFDETCRADLWIAPLADATHRLIVTDPHFHYYLCICIYHMFESLERALLTDR